MAQKNHPQFVQAKGAPAGFVLPFPVLIDAKARHFIEDLNPDSPTNLALQAATGAFRVTAIGGGIFMASKEDVSKSATVQASVDLTIAANPTHGDSFVLGDQTYNLKSSILGTAQKTLSLTGAIVPGSHAESVVTSDATNVAEDETLTIGATVYRFRDTLAQAYDVKIGASAAATLDNLKAAINVSGTEGVEYFAGTLAHPTVVATDNADTTQKIVARVPGTAANTAATETTAAHLSWADTTLGGGTGASNPGVAPETVTIRAVTYSFVDVLSETNAPAAAIANQVLFGADSAAALDNLKSAVNGTAGEGTTYSTGTDQPVDVVATTNANDSQLFVASTAGAAANAYTVAETLSNGEFDAGSTFLGGYDDDGMTIVLDSSAGATQTRVRAAINGTGTPGTDYSSALVENDKVFCGAFGTNVATITAEAVGAAGNGIVSTSDFTSGSNLFSAATLTGGVTGSNFDAYIAAGETFDFGRDEDVSVLSFIAVGATTDLVVVEY